MSPIHVAHVAHFHVAHVAHVAHIHVAHVVGESNEMHLEIYFNAATAYRQILRLPQRNWAAPREPKLMWPEKAIDILVQDRTQAEPVAFKNIAGTLNRLFPDNARKFTAKDCSNKWARTFPTNQDALATFRYLQKLAVDWPGLKFKIDKVYVGPERDVYISAIYIVWPWADGYMARLFHSIFCDASFNITCFYYKVVFITTLDGNKQHRPLMTTFMLQQDANQWARVFNFFAE